LAEWPYAPARAEGTIRATALRPFSARELAKKPTLFTGFMGDVDTSYMTLGQLRAIYRERSNALHTGQDEAEDLRVDRFISDMASGRWNTDVVMRIGVFDAAVLVIDGIHRGIAYLACIEKGISPDRLPALRVDC
jgi:hypothetical protein